MEFDHNQPSDTTLIGESPTSAKTGQKSRSLIPVVNSRNNAQSIIYMAREEQYNCQLEVKAATTQLHHALVEAKAARLRLVKAKTQLIKADFQVGETRLIVQACGFGDVLRPHVDRERLFGVRMGNEYIVTASDTELCAVLD
ncbi:hypothetical protein Hypma_004160 [Hypsizygus marmoreus]|uniref:Uncharacterized protein n=1 Tax=Hypsizygus marmoreus TaxID=39966 RepID=A0A369J718_HYPMA|nr:hypothetical protein Hypma_004160 [Hypsizygus marmoreus]